MSAPSCAHGNCGTHPTSQTAGGKLKARCDLHLEERRGNQQNEPSTLKRKREALEARAAKKAKVEADAKQARRQKRVKNRRARLRAKMEACLATEREVERLLELVGTPANGRKRQPQRWKATKELIAARMRQGDETEALRWVRTLKEGAEAGDVDAVYYMGAMLADDHGTFRPLKPSARAWWEKGLALGPPGQYNSCGILNTHKVFREYPVDEEEFWLGQLLAKLE
jgi:TPR repeat protein